MKKIYSIILFAGILPILVSSQSLSPFIIAPTGGFYSDANGSLAYTCGEMTMVETFKSSNNYLTQGFHQPNEYVCSDCDSMVLNLYPNPNFGLFWYEFIADEDAEKVVIMYNDLGQIVRVFHFHQNVGFNKWEFDVTGANTLFHQGIVAAGMYFLWMEMKNEEGAVKPVTKKVIILK